VVSAVTVLMLPRLVRLAITRFGHRVSEPEIKLLLVVLFALGGLATQAGSEAVLPAYAEEEEALGEEDLSIIHHQRAQPPGGSRTRSAAPSPDPADPSSR